MSEPLRIAMADPTTGRQLRKLYEIRHDGAHPHRFAFDKLLETLETVRIIEGKA